MHRSLGLHDSLGAERFVDMFRDFQRDLEPAPEQECIAGPSYSQ